MTPKGAKACGLLALLARQPRMEHSQVWLQDKLWSDRGRDQAAASLRQALSQLRRDLGPAAGVLQITRTRVALDARRIRIADPDGAAPRAFLEGIDIRDPEFEDWLRVERASQPHTGVQDHAGLTASPALRRTDLARPVHLLGLTRAP